MDRLRRKWSEKGSGWIFLCRGGCGVMCGNKEWKGEKRGREREWQDDDERKNMWFYQLL